MIGKFIKKIAMVALALTICTSVIPTSTYAATVNESTSVNVAVTKSDPVNLVTNYLKAIKDGNIDKAVAILKEDGLTEAQQKKEISQLLKNADSKIDKIKNVTLVKNSSNTATLNITVEYGDGSIIQSPVSLEKDSETYKFKRLDADENVIQKATKTNMNVSKTLGLNSYSQTELVDWNLDADEPGITRYTDTFSARNVRYFVANIWAPIDVQLAIVKKGVFSDTLLTNTVNLSGDQDSQQASFDIKSGSSVSNASLRIGFVHSGSSYGELYAVS